MAAQITLGMELQALQNHMLNSRAAIQQSISSQEHCIKRDQAALIVYKNGLAKTGYSIFKEKMGGLLDETKRQLKQTEISILR